MKKWKSIRLMCLIGAVLLQMENMDALAAEPGFMAMKSGISRLAFGGRTTEGGPWRPDQKVGNEWGTSGRSG